MGYVPTISNGIQSNKIVNEYKEKTKELHGEKMRERGIR